jgi:S1-C subfamily serine protease
LVANSGLILNPMEGSVAENLGLRAGDVLLEVRDET